MKEFMAKKQSKGRPPNYVLDEKGKDVYGLSFNKANNMYYATHSTPRKYFVAGGKTKDRKNIAVKQFREWRKTQFLSPQQQQEKEMLDKIYQKARQLLSEDSYICEEVTKKAKKLLDEAKKNGYEAFAEQVHDKAEELGEQLILAGKYDGYFIPRLENILSKDEHSKTLSAGIVELLKNGKLETFKKYLWEIIYKLLEDDPIKAAKAIGFPGLVFINTPWQYKLDWSTAWQIFYIYKPTKAYLFDAEWYNMVQRKLTLRLKGKSLDGINYDDLLNAITFNMSQNSKIKSENAMTNLILYGIRDVTEFFAQYNGIPIEKRLKLLEEVFFTLKETGFPQSERILQLLKEINKELVD
jgi:hypothetical protein